MPPPPPPARPQTIKQAKAAYRTRGRPSLSEREKRQLERAAELDCRAWRSKEAERKKVDAAKKRIEKERREKDEREKALMGSQRRCDRFGYKSSQLHLGAFLGKMNTKSDEQKENSETATGDQESESFGDDDVDDETLLEALDGTNEIETTHTPAAQAFTRPHESTDIPEQRILAKVQLNKTEQPLPKTSHTFNQHTSAKTQLPRTKPPMPAPHELESVWDELESSTQIARELSTDEPVNAEQNPPSHSRSFGSDDFDLTVEDLEELIPPREADRKQAEDRKLMPPPPLPARRASCKPEYTMSELERFVDDDLCLTQVG